MDGYRLTECLRYEGFTSKAIGVTAATIGDGAARLLGVSADAVIPKPLTISALNKQLIS